MKKRTKCVSINDRFVSFQTFLLPGQAYRISIPNSKNTEITRELQELVFSSPKVIRKLREVALQDDNQDPVEFKFQEESIDRWTKSSETDWQFALAAASSVVENIYDDEFSGSLKSEGKKELHIS